jgi:16S rRNA (guanine527-N7)-methyltransferase
VKPRDWGELSEVLGHRLHDEDMGLLERFSSWLVEEAIPAGGLGPNEVERIGDRHIVDSLLFARCLDDPATVWDLGSGVGLPGIPLAILMPDSSFTLIDRSRRRVDLMNRASRMLGLANVTVEMGDIDHLTGTADAIVARAVTAPQTLLPIAHRHLESGGVAVVGGSWASPPEIPGWETVEVGSLALDRPVWLLMMRHS